MPDLYFKAFFTSFLSSISKVTCNFNNTEDFIPISEKMCNMQGQKNEAIVSTV